MMENQGIYRKPKNMANDLQDKFENLCSTSKDLTILFIFSGISFLSLILCDAGQI